MEKVRKTTILLPARAYRVEIAKQMLATDAPLVTVALECGFCSQAHFTTVFKKMVGLSPGQFRRQALTG